MKQTNDVYKNLDEIGRFTIVKDWNKIHIVRDDYDNYIHVFDNSNPRLNPSSFLWAEEFIPVETVIELVRAGKYGLKYGKATRSIETPKRVNVMWSLKEAIGKPYLKHWTELVGYYSDKHLSEPLTYEGDGDFKDEFYGRPGTREWNYKMANAFLGLGEYNDVLLKFFGDKDAIERAFKGNRLAIPESVQRFLVSLS